MTYIRKMKDWTEKVYYSSSEMDEKLDKLILQYWEELRQEIIEERNKKNVRNNDYSISFNEKELCIA